MAFKKERLEKIIARELGDIIMRDIKDDRIKFVSITNVNLTNDLSIATVFYTVFGNEGQIENSSKVFNEAKPYIRTILAKRIQVKKKRVSNKHTTAPIKHPFPNIYFKS